MPPVRIAGAAQTRFGRLREPLVELMAEAAEGAIADAGGDRRFDHVFVASYAAEALAGTANLAATVAARLGLLPTPATRIETGPSSGSSALSAARDAIASGRARRVLVVGGEVMTRASTRDVSAVLATMLPAHERGLGLTMAAAVAMMTRAYMDVTDLTRERLALVPVKAHAHGAGNPDAQFRNRITVEDVLASPLVADPLRLYDCAPITDGAAALVLDARRGATRILGLGHATDTPGLAERRSPDPLLGFEATRIAARSAFRAARLRPRNVDVVELHDAFSVLALAAAEDLGLFRRGEAVRAVEQGGTSLGGAMPVNPGGGLKARGHPVGATGVAQLVELHRQLAGTAGRRQVDGARVGLAHNIGGLGSNVLVTILGRA